MYSPDLLIHPDSINIDPPSAPSFEKKIEGTFDTKLKPDDIKSVSWVIEKVKYNPNPFLNKKIGAVTWSYNNNTWEATIPISEELKKTLSIQIIDRYENFYYKSINLQLVNEKPILTITAPETPYNKITWQDQGVEFQVAGTARDTAGIRTVQWQKDEEEAWADAANSTGDWSQWRFTAKFDKPGLHKVYVRAIDNLGLANDTTTLEVDVAVPIEVDNFGYADYLKDLIVFVGRRVKSMGSNNISLTDNYHQPFDTLLNNPPGEYTIQKVSQVRIAIEVLRSYLSGSNFFTYAPAYCEKAYHALLSGFGTSYAEIRLARAADEQARKNLANRLGIDLTELDELFIPPGEISEVRLQDLFGLADTNQSTAPTGDPQILTWQLNQLEAEWLLQDKQEYQMSSIPVPAIEPDVMDKNDVKTDLLNNPVTAILEERKKWVSEQRAAIQTAREAKNTPLAGFDNLIAYLYGNKVAWPAIEQEYLDGKNIEADIKPLYLELAEFLALLGIRNLAQGGEVMAVEWDTVYDILVQAKKKQQYKLWAQEEIEKKVTLKPEFFRQRDAQPAPAPWRSSWRSRRNWEKNLEARIKQRASIIEAHKNTIERVEEIILPQLRDELIANICKSQYAYFDHPEFAADWLSKRLSISFRQIGKLRLTRLEQAVETVQDILLSLRTGRSNEPMHPFEMYVASPKPDWELNLSDKYTENDFDEEWQWMGSYATWRGAMYAFAYPENYLLPTLRKQTEWTKAFRQIVIETRQSPGLTASKAEELAAKYIKDLKELDGIAFDIKLTSQLSKDGFKELEQKSKDLLINYFDWYQHKLKPDTPVHLKEVFFHVPLLIALALQKSGKFLEALDWFQTVYAYDLPWAPGLNENPRKIYYGLKAEQFEQSQFRRTYSWLTDGLDIFSIADDRANAYTRFTLISIIKCFNAFADSEFTKDTNESVTYAHQLYQTANDLLKDLKSFALVGSIFPENPVISALEFHTELNLYKIREGLNIAGMERIGTEPVAAAALMEMNGTLAPATNSYLTRPTAYRYSTLIERAKQLVSIAQQIESDFFATLEKKDAEAYNLLTARQDTQLAKETVQVQDLRIQEADSNIKLMQLGLNSAEIQFDTYEKWITAGPNEYERKMLKNYEQIKWVKNAQAAAEAVAEIANAAISAETWKSGLVGVVAGAEAKKLASQIRINEYEGDLQKHTFYASLERNKQEWTLQKDLVSKEKEKATEQILQAKITRQIAAKEQAISKIRVEQTEAIVEFLNNKFTNVELYEWMSGVLSDVYCYFLQQATVMAQMAFSQLAFERQETLPNFIRSDYWQAPEEMQHFGNGEEKDRKGLTGSARLLRDIYQLDQYAFETNKRKLQLEEQISVARLAPYAFQVFRESGVLRFNTPMSLFDRYFPGHYLRLIKRIRVSIAGFIPPYPGIHATLKAAGTSRVVTGGELFQPIEIRRTPEMIAFTSTTNATGLFELETENELLLPFEGMGVDASWELQLPKAANPFDFNNLSDVILTMEYTALQSSDYRRQVIRELDRTFQAERVYSFKNDFPDSWTQLQEYKKKAGAKSDEIPVTISIDSNHFPVHLEYIQIAHLVLYVARADQETFEIAINDLWLDKVHATPQSAQSVEGIISTRSASGLNWVSFIGKSPVGQWTFVISNGDKVKNYIQNNQLEDMLFLVSYSGDTPEWPE